MYTSINSWEGESNVLSQEPEVSCDDLSVTGVVVDLSLQHSINIQHQGVASITPNISC